MYHVPRCIQYTCIIYCYYTIVTSITAVGASYTINIARDRTAIAKLSTQVTNKRSICRRLLQFPKSVSSKAAGETVVDWKAGGQRPRQ